MCSEEPNGMNVKGTTVTQSSLWGSWQERIQALNNVPALIRIVWQSGPSVVCGIVSCRLIAALMPLAMLAVSKKILDGVQLHYSGKPLPQGFWVLVAIEFALAAVAAIASRAIAYFDAVLAERYMRHVSLRLMEHASRLD